ncbi:MAG: 30S ribosomal protein S6 [Candidatus Paceibacterota bacterium]|jgi:ribosomal protein S6
MEEKTSKEGMQVYEVGFHIAPFVGDENVAHEVSAIKDALEKIKAEVISEDFPRLRPLAYPIDKLIKGDKKICNEAYFGWIKFEAPTEAIDGFKKEMEKRENVIRSLIIKTVRESTLYGMKFLKDKEMKREKREGEKDEPKQEINEVELDKSIDSLVV